MKILNLILALIFLGACSNTIISIDTDTTNKSYIQEILRINSDCSVCNNKSGSDIIINGSIYKSDIALKCCLVRNKIDSSPDIKKVYVHGIFDNRPEIKSIKYIKDDEIINFDTDFQLEKTLYVFLKHELKNRGIILIDNLKNPYDYKIDLIIDNLSGKYVFKNKEFNAILSAKMIISNINFNKKINLSTNAQVGNLLARYKEDFNFYLALLAKQLANKISLQILDL